MVKLILRRLLVLPLILLGVAAMTFALTYISPFDPVDAYVGVENQVSEETKQEIARAWGLDRPVHEQFVIWISNLAQGDLGNSRLLAGQPVLDEILARAPASMLLVGGALVLVLIGGLAAGILAAAFRDTWVDWLIRTLCYFNTSSPSFWIALLALYLFSIKLNWLPAGGTSDLRAAETSGLDFSYLILPMLTLALTQYAWFTLFVRNTLLEVLREDHVQFARAQGVSETAVLLRYALPNALIPFVTLVGTNLSELIGGAVLIESIFGWPGLGNLAVQAALSVDLPLLVAITLASSVLVVLGNLLADVLYQFLDPRIREALP
ncbi:MAG: ABC transporter permease [Rubrobacter sp.]